MTLPLRVRTDKQIEIHLVGIGKKGQCLLFLNVRFFTILYFRTKKLVM